MTETKETTLIIGGPGKTGRRVAERLEALGKPTQYGSRSSEIPFDWNDPSTWEPALQGMSAAYVTYYPDLAFPGASEKIRAFAELAVRNGVRRLVLLSGRGEEGAHASEEALKESGADWTVVQSSWFMQNFSEYFLLDPVLDGAIALPVGDVTEPFVDIDDLADVVVEALTDDRHIGQTYELTGPRLLSFAEVGKELSEVIGREVQYVPITSEEYIAGAIEAGVPAEEAEGFDALFTEVLDGRNEHVTDGVERALGRKPNDFADYARAAAATGVWDV
jgi:uncharacterized protein YbjT (DUF2867 family)